MEPNYQSQSTQSSLTLLMRSGNIDGFRSTVEEGIIDLNERGYVVFS